MPDVDWFLAFAQTTFPTFLAVPPLITSFHIPIKPAEVAQFFALLWAYYAVIVAQLFVVLTTRDSATTLVPFLIGVALVGIAPLVVMKWTLEEQIWLWEQLQSDE